MDGVAGELAALAHPPYPRERISVLPLEEWLWLL
jgi:hypothetical protein